MINISSDLDHGLLAALARMLELDPALTKDEALNRLERIAADSGLSNARPRLTSLCDLLTPHAVLSPAWLQEEGLRPHFFLANGRPGFLEHLVRQSEEVRPGMSHYLLYGDWDALIVLHGSEAEADDLRASLHMGAYSDPVQFTAEHVLLAYRHRVKQLSGDRVSTSTDAVNALTHDFDSASGQDLRDRLLVSGHLLGPTWRLDAQQPYPVVAFVGLSLRGRAYVAPSEVLDTLLSRDPLRQCLVHAFQIRHGQPFHYFLKLCCVNMQELDEATNAIGFSSAGTVRFEGATLVVASGTDQVPTFRKADVAGLPLAPDLTSMVRAGERVFQRLQADQQEAFNRLDASQQISVVRSLAEIGDRIDAAVLSPTTRDRLTTALSTFSRECTVNVGQPNLTGAVTEVTAAIEGDLKRLLSRLAYRTYGKDPARIQRELRLPTRAIRNLSLGKAVQALQLAADHPDFGPLADMLDEAWLERLERFAATRNRWAHDAVAADNEGLRLIDEAHATLVEAVEIASWIEACLAEIVSTSEPTLGDERGTIEIEVSSSPRDRELGVFISHATADNLVAERVAMGLKAFGVPSWYAEWELKPGDSIVSRVESALARSDTLLVLLSAQSVASKWVRRELNTALMAQLSGQDISVIPVIVEDCELPEILRDVLYVDLRDNFEEGLFALLNTLRDRYRG